MSNLEAVMTSVPVLETTSLQKHIEKIHAVDGVNPLLNSVVLLGINESSKTTLIRLCLGLLE